MIPAPATTTRFTRAALAGNPVMSGTDSNSSSLRRSIDILEYSVSNPAIIGIDLGTTNCALAFTREDSVDVFPIPQLVNPGEVREEPLLPSFLFLEGDPPIVGVLAQKRGLENAGRLVSSAKSWLSHAGVDRTAAILPPNAPDGVLKISPVDASRRYLAHLRDAWNTKTPDASFDAHQVLVTVPASFDAVARDLTLKAAEEAGYRNVILLEEPQAAFYAWLERHPDWRDRVGVGDLILVVDIGGGTTDFTLIAVREQDGGLALERIAVGDHILLGGDNIDIALAHRVAQELPKLDAIQFHALWQQCRAAKERLLAEGQSAKEAPITILGRGTGVVGGTIKTKLKRADIDRILLDGFLPVVAMDEVPQRRRAGLAEIGLPYAADAAITRHLADFLRRQGATPTHVLFNGGVLRANLIRKRILEVLNGWLAQPVKALVGEDLMHAVARGAAYYGLARQGKGVRIRGGVPRSYYVGIETATPAVPGMAAPLKALTVAPFGMEEGTGHKFPNRVFALTVGEPAHFRFFQSSIRKDDPPGSMLDEIGPELEELSPVEVSLPGNAGEAVPVSLEALVTETGMLELWCVSRDGRRWKLEFNVRTGGAGARPARK
jgi:molecular chaperone DnaK (HSP70)